MTSLKAFGASVNSYYCNLGWNSQPTQFTVRVAEDFSDSDSFTNPNPGDIAYFSHGSLQFGGHVQSRTRINDFNGNPLYEIVLVDPREILDGVQLILSDYNGSVPNIPNLWNVYGYWENQGFGYSNLTDTGMPLFKILSAAQYFNTLVLNDSYGGPIRFKNNIYRVDLSGIPGYPNNYRIPGPSISLLQLILETCNEAGHDVFFELVQTPTGNWITTRAVSRVFQPDLTRIAAFVGNSQGAESTDVGVELRNEKTSSFLVGGNRIDLFQQYDNRLTGTSATIWQYWGLDANGDAIIGTGTGNSHTFTVDSRGVNVPGIGSNYTMTVAELRAALAGQDEWETFIAVVRPDIATRIGLQQKFDADFISDLINRDLSPKELFNTTLQKAKFVERGVSTHEENLTRLYEFVRSYGADYYGRKFMVRIPFAFAYQDPESLVVSLSHEPADAGFIEESAEPLGLSTVGQDTFRVEDGRLTAFVRYEDYTQIDLSIFSPDDYWIEDGKLFLAASLEPYIVYADTSLQYSPRVVINLSSPVYYLRDYTDDRVAPYFGLFEYIIRVLLGEDVSDAQLAQLKKNLNTPGALALFAGFTKEVISPHMVAAPLQNNTECYGPWYAIGAVGKVEFEKNESLVPWNYGDYDTMNLVANATVQNGLTNMQVSELGNVTLPGEPTVSLGRQLIAGGPYVTNMTVSVDPEGGTKTSYSMRTYTPKYNPFVKSNIDTVTKLGVRNQKLRRAMRQALRFPPPGANIYKQRENYYKVASRRNPNTPHEMVVSKIIGDKVTTAFGTIEQSLADLSAFDSNEYISTAGVELGSLFVPYSTYHNNAGDIPRFLAFSGLTGDITASSLNPFSGSGIDIVVRGSVFPEDLSCYKDSVPNSGYNDFRGIALRSPLVLAGWGYDINGSSVSSSNDSPINWKVGPLATQWDEERGVWEAGGGGNKLVKIIDSGSFPIATESQVLGGNFKKVYRAVEMKVDFPEYEGSGVTLSSGNYLFVGNFRSNIITPNKLYMASKVNGKYVIDNQAQFWEIN